MPETVTVACRLPHGMHLDVYRDRDAAKTMRSAGQNPLHLRSRVTLAGANKSTLIGGCGITEVPKDHWDAWLAAHKDEPYIRNGFIWATKSQMDAAQEAKSREKDKTGFEGADVSEVDRRLAELQRE